jgi:hypothetical protein
MRCNVKVLLSFMRASSDVAAGEESVAEHQRHEVLMSEIRRSSTDAMNFFNGRIEFFWARVLN